MEQKPVTVIGGGFSGLVTAYYLVQAGFDVRLFEKEARWGGLLGTHYEPWGLVETAANGILNSFELHDLAKNIGVRLLPTRLESRNRYIYRNGPKRWPLTLSESLNLVRSLVRALMKGKAGFAPQTNETLGHWAERLFGEEVLRYFIEPGQQGIFAGDVRELSAELILKPPSRERGFKRSQGHYHRGTVAPEKGMQQFVDQLVAFLREKGVEMVLNADPELGTEPNHPHVLCVGPQAAAKILKSSDPHLSAQLKNLDLLPLASLTMHFDKNEGTLKGFGCLFPRDQGIRSLGVLFNRYIFSGRTEAHTETWILGGALDREIADAPEWEIVHAALADREKLYGRRVEPLHTKLTVWPKAIPHYDLGLKEFLGDLTEPKNILLNGNYMGGIGLSRILQRAKNIAEQLGASSEF